MIVRLLSSLASPTRSRIACSLVLAGVGVGVVANTPTTWERRTTTTESVVLHRTPDDVFVPPDKLPLPGSEVWTFGVTLDYHRTLFAERHAAELTPVYRTTWDDRRLSLPEPGSDDARGTSHAGSALVRLRGGLWGEQFSRVIESGQNAATERSLVGLAVMTSRFSAFALVTLGLAGAAALIARRARVKARVRAYAQRRCPSCRYSLRDIERDICPECGAVPSRDALNALRLLRQYPAKQRRHRNPDQPTHPIHADRSTPFARSAQNALRSLADGMPS